MKKFRNIMLIILVLVGIILISSGLIYNYKMAPVSNSKEAVEIVIPSGTSISQIAEQLEEEGLIRDAKFFVLYTKLFKINNIKASTYQITPDMGVENIVKLLENGNNYNPDMITITFKEGINMREIAKVISENTNCSYEDVIAKTSDDEYIDELIDKYWFITEDIKNKDIYYALEGYLFPNTYQFRNKEVSVEEIFNVMIEEMNKVLSPYQEKIENGKLSVHEILSLASMVEKEAAITKDRSKVASVFLNRRDKKMSLGSDVTTRYALKIDNPKQALNKSQYQTINPYNTRDTSGAMNGKLPVGPICAPSKLSIIASIEPEETSYLYFLANIQTQETFFFTNSKSFEQKKIELAKVNGGL